MPLFVKPYRSEITQFLDQLKADKPQLEAQQLAGRALLWDKQVDLQEQQAEQAGTIVPKPYSHSKA